MLAYCVYVSKVASIDGVMHFLVACHCTILCISTGSTKVPNKPVYNWFSRFCTTTLVSVCLSVCQAHGWARATCENHAYYDDCNPNLNTTVFSVVAFFSLLCFRLVILLFYVFMVYLYPCAAHCSYSINE